MWIGCVVECVCLVCVVVYVVYRFLTIVVRDDECKVVGVVVNLICVVVLCGVGDLEFKVGFEIILDVYFVVLLYGVDALRGAEIGVRFLRRFEGGVIVCFCECFG